MSTGWLIGSAVIAVIVEHRLVNWKCCNCSYSGPLNRGVAQGH